MTENNDVCQAECTCPKGKDKCSHMACILLYCCYNLSTTDLKCTWRRPSQPPNMEAKPVPLYTKVRKHSALKRKLADTEIKDVEQILKNCCPSETFGMGLILSEPEN